MRFFFVSLIPQLIGLWLDKLIHALKISEFTFVVDISAVNSFADKEACSLESLETEFQSTPGNGCLSCCFPHY